MKNKSVYHFFLLEMHRHTFAQEMGLHFIFQFKQNFHLIYNEQVFLKKYHFYGLQDISVCDYVTIY